MSAITEARRAVVAERGWTNTPPIDPDPVEAIRRAAAAWARCLAELPARAAEADAGLAKMARAVQMDEG